MFNLCINLPFISSCFQFLVLVKLEITHLSDCIREVFEGLTPHLQMPGFISFPQTTIGVVSSIDMQHQLVQWIVPLEGGYIRYIMVLSLMMSNIPNDHVTVPRPHLERSLACGMFVAQVRPFDHRWYTSFLATFCWIPSILNNEYITCYLHKFAKSCNIHLSAYILHLSLSLVHVSLSFDITVRIVIWPQPPEPILIVWRA